MKKKLISFGLIIVMLLSLTACGDKGPDVTGKYICVGESYFGEALSEPYEESWLELKKGGKGTYYSGFEFELKWKLDGETFTGTVSFLGMDEAMEGTLKDGVIDVKYGDMNIRFVKEGMEAPADSGASIPDTNSPATETETERAGLVGYYTLYKAVIQGTTMTYSDLVAADLAEGSYLNMFDDGFGELAFADEIADSFSYDESTGLLTFNPGETLAFTVDGDHISVEFPDQDMVLTFELAQGQSSAATTGNGVVAGSIAEAFAGVNAFVGVPDEVLTGNWFGWIKESECWGGHAEDFQAAWGKINNNSDSGQWYFDLFKDGDSETPVLSMWIEKSADDTELIPDIGDEDAWVLDTYLTEDEEPLFNTTISPDGSLYLTYEYVTEDGASGCLVEIFLRKDGAAWNEAADTLPPRYEEYKTAITD